MYEFRRVYQRAQPSVNPNNTKQPQRQSNAADHGRQQHPPALLPGRQNNPKQPQRQSAAAPVSNNTNQRRQSTTKSHSNSWANTKPDPQCHDPRPVEHEPQDTTQTRPIAQSPNVWGKTGALQRYQGYNPYASKSPAPTPQSKPMAPKTSARYTPSARLPEPNGICQPPFANKANCNVPGSTNDRSWACVICGMFMVFDQTCPKRSHHFGRGRSR